ncbi:sugar phosphate isomerase/epimerase family protein [Rubinisphaera margarita]|uniref:sugar phosphate isomerase/epimerase family protein n=1 Tax=Rubinisphaera margarita TaxID=2909586 RepID=UPI001EE796DB|nr:TIM barrel protein [Rubinisphaera margarita]MCG6156364.1 sugar phosphate isomerase/epimerase [Rubinisphaera margarita]
MNDQLFINRRAALRQLGAIAACATVTSAYAGASAESAMRTGMGLVIYDCTLRRSWMRQQEPDFDLFNPLNFLKHCHSLGAGGMQADLGVLKPGDVDELRKFAGQHGLFIDAIVKPPKDEADLGRFEAEIRTAREVGVQAARTTIIPGRRYERFKTLEEFREFEKRGREMLERAAPVVEKHRVPFAVENHKDQRIDERIALFKHLDSEFIGACVDTGNSFALLEGAYEPIEALAPYTFTVHLKDQALRSYSDGFLLGDIPLGQGSFDLKRMVATIREMKPGVRFALELITRDPLKVPCLTDGYYSTMPASQAIDLARTMRFVRDHSSGHLQQVSTLPLNKQVDLEDANVKASIRYAGEELQL